MPLLVRNYFTGEDYPGLITHAKIVCVCMKTNLDGYLNDILVVMCKFRNYKAEMFKVDRKSMQLENSSQFGHVDFLRI